MTGDYCRHWLTVRAWKAFRKGQRSSGMLGADWIGAGKGRAEQGRDSADTKWAAQGAARAEKGGNKRVERGPAVRGGGEGGGLHASCTNGSAAGSSAVTAR